MYKILYFGIISSILLSCKKEPPAKPSSDINSAVDAAILPPPSPTTSVKYRDTALEDVLVNGVTKKCRTYMADRIQRLSSFDYFYAEDKGDIWPGNLVQSKYLRENGRLVSLGNFPRDPLNYTFQGSMGSKSVNIAAPTNASYQTTFDDVSKLFWFMPPTYSQQTVQITYSTEQSLLDLGINYGFLAGNLAAKFQTTNTNGNTTLYMVVKNVYFNTSVEYPSNPAGFFGQNVNVSDLKRLINEDNAPAYISNISYGRVALVKLVSSYTQREVKASVELVLRGLGASLTAGQKSLVSELQLTIEAAPGPSYVLKTLDDVYKFMDEGSQFNHRNGCVPVGYEARYLKNNSILMTHTGISHKINDCL
jgi:hypothetical protein